MNLKGKLSINNSLAGNSKLSINHSLAGTGNYAGEKGPIGPTGPQGPTGPMGATGTPGSADITITNTGYATGETLATITAGDKTYPIKECALNSGDDVYVSTYGNSGGQRWRVIETIYGGKQVVRFNYISNGYNINSRFVNDEKIRVINRVYGICPDLEEDVDYSVWVRLYPMYVSVEGAPTSAFKTQTVNGVRFRKTGSTSDVDMWESTEEAGMYGIITIYSYKYINNPYCEIETNTITQTYTDETYGTYTVVYGMIKSGFYNIYIPNNQYVKSYLIQPIKRRFIPSGTMGPTGPAGADGAVGPTGPTGADGAVGPTGATGAVGPTGPAGGGGGVNLTFTNGLTENSGTVGFAYNDYIKVKPLKYTTGAVVLGVQNNGTLGPTDDRRADGSLSVGYILGNGAIRGNEKGAIGMGYAGYGNIIAYGTGCIAAGYAPSAADNVYAYGYGTFAMGTAVKTGGYNSTAMGCGIKATSNYQTAIGRWNVENNNGTYAFIIGNGTEDNARSNAMTVDWNGNIIANNLPSPGSTDGDYILKCTITNGTPTYSWIPYQP